MSQCTLIILDSGPLNSLWVADRLDLLLTLDMRLVLVDTVYDELTSDLTDPRDRAVKAFIDGNQPPFIIETTGVGALERERRSKGGKPKKNAGEVSVVSFLTSADGFRKYVGTGDPVAILYEDAAIRLVSNPPNLHMLSTVGMLRGLEYVDIIPSADTIIHEMTHPSKPDRRPEYRRVATDLPDGIDDPAAIGSTRVP